MAITRVTFLACNAGEWRIDGVRAVVGETLPAAAALSRVEGDAFQSDAQAAWSLMGVRSNERCIEAAEKKVIGPLQEDLGRADRTLAGPTAIGGCCRKTKGGPSLRISRDTSPSVVSTFRQWHGGYITVAT